MKFIPVTCTVLLLAGCGIGEVGPEKLVTFQNPIGDTISISHAQALVGGTSYPGHDCSTTKMQCVDYSGYFTILSPRNCKDIHTHPWQAGSLLATNLGVDHHRSRTMYGANRGEMVSYLYSWDGDGVVGLAFDSTHKVGNLKVLENMGYRSSSIFYEKVSGPAFMPCHPGKKSDT